MTTQEIANKLVAACREGKDHDIQTELYSQNAVSWEPQGGNWGEKTEGLDGIRAKSQQWQSMVEEIHSADISDPVVGGNHFSCSFAYEVTMKGAGRIKMEEIAVYEVQNEKIVSERFFYPVAPKQ